MLNKLICLFKGHRRGKRIQVLDAGARLAESKGVHSYQCPRCKATWTRKVKS